MPRTYLRPTLVLLLLVAATLAPSVASSQSQPTTYSLFSAAAAPARPGGTDQLSVELGVIFSVDTPGAISAIRFYKAAISNPQHTVSFWTSDGQLLARALTASETSNGWQQASLT